jgi:hypothetical protein
MTIALASKPGLSGVTVLSIPKDWDGVTIGNPTGGSNGPGTLNVASGVFLNGVAYTNP